jgi:hypothetical protein
MNNDAIRVVKPDKEVGAPKTRVDLDPAKIESDVHQKLVDTVENWISERRENSRLEKFFRQTEFQRGKICPLVNKYV